MHPSAYELILMLERRGSQTIPDARLRSLCEVRQRFVDMHFADTKRTLPPPRVELLFCSLLAQVGCMATWSMPTQGHANPKLVWVPTFLLFLNTIQPMLEAICMSLRILLD